jgi:hypothetical protein
LIAPRPALLSGVSGSAADSILPTTTDGALGQDTLQASDARMTFRRSVMVQEYAQSVQINLTRPNTIRNDSHGVWPQDGQGTRASDVGERCEAPADTDFIGHMRHRLTAGARVFHKHSAAGHRGRALSA